MISDGAHREYMLGQLAVDLGLISYEQLEYCLQEQGRDRQPLGQILVSNRFLNLQQLTDVIEMQAQYRKAKASSS